MEKTSIKTLQELNNLSDKSIHSLEDIIPTMDKIQKDMLWNKVCSIEKKLNIIIEMLGDKNGEK